MDKPSGKMRSSYADYYGVVEQSPAHARFCEYAYGKNLCQHGFATIEQLNGLIQATGLNPQNHAVDLGCGNGMMAEYLSDVTGAHVTGLDYIPSAIAHAATRTQAKGHRLDFVVGDLTQPELPPGSFDVLFSIDTIYFANDYAETIRRWLA